MAASRSISSAKPSTSGTRKPPAARKTKPTSRLSAIPPPHKIAKRVVLCVLCGTPPFVYFAVKTLPPSFPLHFSVRKSFPLQNPVRPPTGGLRMLAAWMVAREDGQTKGFTPLGFADGLRERTSLPAVDSFPSTAFPACKAVPDPFVYPAPAHRKQWSATAGLRS